VTPRNHQCSHHAQEEESLREFWRAPADALAVKQELEKPLAQDGKPTCPRERQGDSVNEPTQRETSYVGIFWLVQTSAAQRGNSPQVVP
jgi:hypothetical protein